MLRDSNGRGALWDGVVAKLWQLEKAYQFLSALPSLSSTFEAGNDDSDLAGSTPPLLGQPITDVQGRKCSTGKL